ncbi:glycoside hydrolase family 16 protein [uncultured Shewanella sp.]|uniref:glycoside hydrolase family 16 protein n=1 Tax=uncultured Shewanella sp. TaxID=173975 RepID=UPI0026357CBC|nr:glycoside hydrolase family 16 protein [uncultured Shewanella sp.]
MRKAFNNKSVTLLFGLLLSSTSYSKTLVWEADFNEGSIDTSTWNYETGNTGWGNNELQNYTNDSANAYIEDGAMVIQATKQADGSFNSARLNTKGKLSYQYGTIEARIKVPDLNAGLWPAFWQLGSDIDQVGWPACGELDVFEAGMAAALRENKVNSEASGAFHWWNDSLDYTGYASYSLTKNLVDDFGLSSDLTDYHIFGMTWTPTTVSIWIDDESNQVVSMDINDSNFDAFKQPHYILLNLAVGGAFPQIYSNNDITAPMPAKMYIDYIRIYDNDASDYSTTLSYQ